MASKTRRKCVTGCFEAFGVNDGYLHEHVHVQHHTGQRLVDIEGLREKLQCISNGDPTACSLGAT